MEVIVWIMDRLNEIWNSLKLVDLPYGFNLAQLFIGLLILELIAEFFGIGLYGGHKEIK